MKLRVVLLLVFWCLSCFAQSNRPDGLNARKQISTVELQNNSCDFSAFKPFRVSHFVRSNVKKRFVPEYPQNAMQQNIQGVVSVKILVDRDGNVARVCALDGEGELARVAEDAALKWQFNRKVAPGRNSYVEDALTFRFVLDNGSAEKGTYEELVVRP